MLAVDRTKLIKNKIERIQKNITTEHVDGSELQREDAKLRWWKQKLTKDKAQDKINADGLKRENEDTKKNKRTANELEVAIPILEKHSHIGKGPRKHNSLLNNLIDNFDKEFSKNRKKWLQEELADGPKNAAEVEKKTLTQGMTEKQLRTAKEYAGVSSYKTDFDGGWVLSLSSPNNVP